MSGFGKAVKNKIRETRAFTLAEALVAVIILLLVTVVVAGGIPAAASAYNNVVLASNAEMLLSTTASRLRNELSTAKDITVDEDNNCIQYYNEVFGSYSKIYLGDANANDAASDIMYQRYAADTDIGNVGADAVRLMSAVSSDSDKDLHVRFDSVGYNSTNGVVFFKGLAVTTSDGEDTPAAIKTTAKGQTYTIYSIRVITPE